MRAKMIDYLLLNANPSIQYRVKTEVLNRELSVEEKDQLQAKILQEPIIQSIIACQKENGWLGNGFHGPNKNAGPFPICRKRPEYNPLRLKLIRR